jgi:hypothetical protein
MSGMSRMSFFSLVSRKIAEFCIHFLAVLATAGNPSAIGDTGGGPPRTADYRHGALKRAAGSSREYAASAATMTRKTSTRRAWVVTDMS